MSTTKSRNFSWTRALISTCGTGGDARRYGLLWIARLLQAQLAAEDSEADLEVAPGVVELEALDLVEDAAVPAVHPGAPRRSAIRMRPRRFPAWRLSIACWLRVSM